MSHRLSAVFLPDTALAMQVSRLFLGDNTGQATDAIGLLANLCASVPSVIGWLMSSSERPLFPSPRWCLQGLRSSVRSRRPGFLPEALLVGPLHDGARKRRANLCDAVGTEPLAWH